MFRIDDVFTHLETHSLKHINHDSLVNMLEAIDDLLGLQLIASTPDILDDQKRLIIEREHARETKDWAASDRIRGELKNQGVILRDIPHDTIWEYAS